MNPVVLTSTGRDRIQKIIWVKFGVQLSPAQILKLIAAQPEAIRNILQETPLPPGNLDLIEKTIAEDITGILYPTKHSTPYYKEYFKKKLKENKDRYFDLLS